MIRLIIPKNAQLGERWKMLAIAVGGAFGIAAALVHLSH